MSHGSKLSALALVGMFACSSAKAPPPPDCDAFGKEYGTTLSSPQDGEMTRKVTELLALTFTKQCRDDGWSSALTSCILKAEKGADVLKVCVKEFTPQQAKHLEDVLRRYMGGMQDAVRDAIKPAP